MKFTAVLLLACIVFLSTSSGMQNNIQLPAIKPCCEKASAKSACPKNNADKKDNCGKDGCPMMLTCSICGFLAVTPLKMASAFSSHIPKPIYRYKIGDLSVYHSDDWKPPKI